MEDIMFFNVETMPACLKLIGDKVHHLRSSDIRAFINEKLRATVVDGFFLQFDVDDYDQLVGSFFKDTESISDTFAIRSITTKTLVEKINEEYKKLFNKKGKTMKKKKSSKVTEVTSVNPTDSINVDFLTEFILQHFRGAGQLFQLEKMGALNVSTLCREASGSSIEKITYDTDSVTIYGAGDISSTCSLSLSDEDWSKKVDRRLQLVIKWSHELASEETEASSRAVKDEVVTMDTTIPQATEQKITAKENVCRKKTADSRLRQSHLKIKAVVPVDNNDPLKMYNDSVEQDFNSLEKELRNRGSRSCGQRIRGFLLARAKLTHVRVKKTSIKWLVSPLDEKNKQRLCTFYRRIGHKVPSFLPPYAGSNWSSEKVTMRK